MNVEAINKLPKESPVLPRIYFAIIRELLGYWPSKVFPSVTRTRWILAEPIN